MHTLDRRSRARATPALWHHQHVYIVFSASNPLQAQPFRGMSGLQTEITRCYPLLCRCWCWPWSVLPPLAALHIVPWVWLFVSRPNPSLPYFFSATCLGRCAKETGGGGHTPRPIVDGEPLFHTTLMRLICSNFCPFIRFPIACGPLVGRSLSNLHWTPEYTSCLQGKDLSRTRRPRSASVKIGDF